MDKRRRFIILTLIIMTLSLAGCNIQIGSSGKEDKIKSGSDINFYIATDIHYLSKSLTDGGNAFKKFVSSGAGKQLDYIDEILGAFTYSIVKNKPGVLVISGDLTTNGEKDSHLDLARKLEDIENIGTSVFVIPGNHDISNPWARRFKGDSQYVTGSISPGEFSKIYDDFGYDEAVSRDKSTLSYLAAPSEDVWLLMLDTNQYKDNLTLGFPQTDGVITKDTFEWIKKCTSMAKENGARIIPVMHHSLLHHSPVIQEGYTLNNTGEAVEVFQSVGMEFALSGHIHIQDISSYKNDGNTIYDIATNSLSVYPQQYGILKYSPSSASFDYSTSRVDVESWAKGVGITDENIKNFNAYSEGFFGKLAYDMAYIRLAEDANYTEDEKKAMSETMRILNLRYFAGIEYLNIKDIVNSEGFKLWTKAPPGFLKSYIMTLISDNDTDDNSLHIVVKQE